MSEEVIVRKKPVYHVEPALKVEGSDDQPDLRQWLLDLKRDLTRKIAQIDELLQLLNHS